jgi:tRNA-splicing ligase RtcB|tara:strand:- start:4738 stop:5982 length:1245 start_codon:yes stop_codon:yes gene_type:complete
MNNEQNYNVIKLASGVPLKLWNNGVEFEPEAMRQLYNLAKMPFIYKWVSVMPDAHLGRGACIGSVIPTKGAIIPAAVGVDLGCGMVAVKTDLTANDLPDNLKQLRLAIEKAVPHGRTHNGGNRDKGAWGDIPKRVGNLWVSSLDSRFNDICDKNKHIRKSNHLKHLGTLGGGNHFVEVCLDQNDDVWVMLHSGSRGVGNRIGQEFIKRAKKDMKKHFVNVPHVDLSYLVEGTDHFDDYVEAVEWAQDFARINRQIMMENTLKAMKDSLNMMLFKNNRKPEIAVNCHHNYVTRENHYGENVWVTRKGAVNAAAGRMGIIPGSMGAKSYIVEGKGLPESFNSCSHGAGRCMSRTRAKDTFTLDDHIAATEGVECRKDEDVIDETPMAYKDIEKVMAAQKDLVDVKFTLKQIVCVKG